jgi:predicted membrane chloride channel (bestrophin family)
MELLPPTQWHCVLLEWIMIQLQDGFHLGALQGGAPVQLVLLEKCCELRGTFGSIGDVLAGRMPLAYTHLVQILVDSLLFCAPFALYAELGEFSIVSVGILTLFYSGLLDLSKVLLDPLDNEDYCQGSIKIDLSVLIRETNAASNRWRIGAETLPFSNGPSRS